MELLAVVIVVIIYNWINAHNVSSLVWLVPVALAYA